MMKRFPILSFAAALFLAVALRPAMAEVTVEEVVSPGGITAWFVRDDTVPVLSLEFTFRGAGSTNDPPGLDGVAALTAYTLDEGAGPYDSQAFQQRLNDMSISLSFDAGLDGFSGSFYALNRYRDDAVDLLRLALHEPRFDQEPVDRIRAQMLSGLRQDATDPQAMAGRALMEVLFDGHPYARPSDGRIETLPNVTPDDLDRFRRQVLTRDRLFIGAVGDIEPAELGLILDRVFGDLPAEGTVADVPDIQTPAVPGTLVIDQDVPQTTILFSQPWIGIDDPRFYAGMIMNYVLGGGSFRSILTQEIRVQRGLVYSVYSFQHPMEHAALLRGGAGTQNARAGETVALVREVIARLRDEGLDSTDIADAKTYLTGSYALRFTNSSSIASQLASMQYLDFPIDYFQTRNERIEQVTEAEVNALAAEMLAPDQLTFVLVGRPDGVTPTIDYAPTQ
ncbi:MAG: pitrilysin family protein [Alphaproteobacteria bacterium]